MMPVVAAVLMVSGMREGGEAGWRLLDRRVWLHVLGERQPQHAFPTTGTIYFKQHLSSLLSSWSVE